MKITFFGAAQQVTGSMFLLELDDDYKILIDCGTELGSKGPVHENFDYGIFPFDASLINLVILTHAHIDHSGQIPNLYRYGYEGQVLCTSPTLDLTEILLRDSAMLNIKQLKSIERRKKFAKAFEKDETEGLFVDENVSESVDNFVPIAFNRRFKFKDEAYVTFIPAGHLLGAAHILLEIKENGEWKKVGFSGDIGRENYTLLKDPNPMPEVDFLFMESTYGNRRHQDQGDPVDIMEEIVNEACIETKGRLIIPAFSVGRTQALLYTLNKLYYERNIKPIKVFTDSPLAQSSTRIYNKYKNLLNEEAKEFYEETDSLFDFENLHYLAGTEQSRAVSSHNESCIIISASGMVKGGRIEYHIEKNIENPYATILMVGFAEENSLGAKLLAGEQKELHIRNKNLRVNAKIKRIDIFSGHGDVDDLIKFAENQNRERLKKIFLVHGEIDAMENLKELLNDRGFKNIYIPERFQTFEL